MNELAALYESMIDGLAGCKGWPKAQVSDGTRVKLTCTEGSWGSSHEGMLCYKGKWDSRKTIAMA